MKKAIFVFLGLVAFVGHISVGNANEGNITLTTAEIWSQTISNEPKKYRYTGDLYFDTKEYLNYGDFLLAKKLGIDIQQATEEIKIIEESTEEYKEAAIQGLRTNKMGLEALIMHSKQGGIINGLARSLYDFTDGLTPISAGNLSFIAKDRQFIEAMARMFNGDTITEQDMREVEKVYGAGYASPQRYAGRMSGALWENILTIQSKIKTIADIQTSFGLNREVPQSILNELAAYELLEQYLDKNLGNVSFKRLEVFDNYLNNTPVEQLSIPQMRNLLNLN